MMQIENFDISEIAKRFGWATAIISGIVAFVLSVVRVLPELRKADNEKIRTTAEQMQNSNTAAFSQLKSLVEMLQSQLAVTRENYHKDCDKLKRELELLQSAFEILREENGHLNQKIEALQLFINFNACNENPTGDCPLKKINI